jgi:uncharacterized DUF497 family protein
MYYCAIDVTWDPKKAETNFRKHRIRFSDAETVLYDPTALTIKDQEVSGEKRFVTIGSDAIGRIIVVVYAYRGNTVRLISARKATPTERKQYEKGI